MLRSVRFAGLGIVVIPVLLLTACAGSGDYYAAGIAERVITEIGDNITPAYPTPLEADYLTAWALGAAKIPPGARVHTLDVDALGWEGNSGDPDGARMVLRVDVQVDAYYPSGFERGRDEGQSVRCWELTVFGSRNYDTLRTRELACDPDAPAVTPHPPPRPDYPSDVEERLTGAIEGAAVRDVDARVREAFPDDFYTIESHAEGGELAVALGIPSERECVLGVQFADGSVKVYQGIHTIPGEGSCSPDMYFRPVRTH